VTDLAGLTVDDFAPGDRCSLPGGAVWEVVAAEALTATPGAPRAPFRVEFAGTADQGIHVLEHPRLGSLELFVVPVGPDRLEATFG
jgi:uncharacterized protein DUF6916